MKVFVVTQHRRQHARGAIGGRRHDAPAGRVLLVDGHRVGIHPVQLAQRLDGGTHQSFVQDARAPLHVQAAGQATLGGQAAVHAVEHGAADAIETGLHLGLGAARQLVLHGDVGNAHLPPCAALEQFGGGTIGMRPGDGGRRRGLTQLLLTRDEAATERIEGLRMQQCPATVTGCQPHSVRVQVQAFLAVEDEVARLLERHRMTAEQGDRAGGPNLRDRIAAAIQFHRLGVVPREAKQHGPVRRMAPAGQPERSVERDLELGHGIELLPAFQLPHEAQRDAHGPYRV
jgi:hypothetical protein